jgi:5-methylthioadenosine/S-adenosylhomocysteine deaminase
LLWPVSSPPIHEGAVLVDERGRIREVGAESSVSRPRGCRTLAAAGAVLLPGLVNVHTHLELTGFRGAIPDQQFFDWIQHVRRRKAATAPEAFLEAAREGVREAWTAGITTVADTGDSGAVAQALRDLGGRGLVYHEVFGPHPDQMSEALSGLAAAVERLRRDAAVSVRIGVSPHAPYTVSEPLFRGVAQWARARRLPLAVHLAESQEESAFVTTGTGPFADLWRRRGIPLPPAAPSPVRYLERLGVLGPDTLLIHAVQTDAKDREIVRTTGSALALCPRSNGRHGHGGPAIADYLRLGIPAGLGTDSVASVDSLDLFAEARAARDASALDPSAAIELMTLGGARALGWEREIGSLEPGKWADFCLLELDSLDGPPDHLARWVLEAGPPSVRGTWVAGRQVHGDQGEFD